MILTPHAIIGASVANLFPNEPIVGVVLAYTSHYILDMLPHKDYSISNFYNKETEKLSSIFKSRGAANNFLLIMLDVMVAIVLCSIIFIKDEKSAFITLLGVVGGLLPDFLQLLYFKYKNSTFIFFQKIHDIFSCDIKNKKYFLFGILVQIFVTILVLVIFFAIR